MSDLPDHHCPGCGNAQKSFPRYPWYLCQSCLDKAVDAGGRGLEFTNASLSGGLVWKYRGAHEWHNAVQVLCEISGRPVLVGEARFGGVQAQPAAASPPGGLLSDHVTDLTKNLE